MSDPVFVSYKSLVLLSPTPNGAGGQTLNSNFSSIADFIDATNATLATKANASSLSSYATTTSVTSLLTSYLTASQTTTAISSAIAAIPAVNLSSYVTNSSLATTLGGFSTTVATTSAIATAITSLNLGSLATQNTVDASQITGTLDVARIPVLPSQIQITSSGDLTALTSGQQTQIGQGTVVSTIDGFRYVYSGSGSKTSAGSYIQLADITPDWSVIANKPSFATVATSGSAADLNGTLSDARLSSNVQNVIASVNAATAANTANTIVKRDAGNNINASTISADMAYFSTVASQSGDLSLYSDDTSQVNFNGNTLYSINSISSNSLNIQGDVYSRGVGGGQIIGGGSGDYYSSVAIAGGTVYGSTGFAMGLGAQAGQQGVAIGRASQGDFKAMALGTGARANYYSSSIGDNSGAISYLAFCNQIGFNAQAFRSYSTALTVSTSDNGTSGGHALDIAGTSSTLATRQMASIDCTWATDTDANRKAIATFKVYDTAARTYLTATATGSGVTVTMPAISATSITATTYSGLPPAAPQIKIVGNTAVMTNFPTDASLKVFKYTRHKSGTHKSKVGHVGTACTPHHGKRFVVLATISGFSGTWQISDVASVLHDQGYTTSIISVGRFRFAYIDANGQEGATSQTLIVQKGGHIKLAECGE